MDTIKLNIEPRATAEDRMKEALAYKARVEFEQSQEFKDWQGKASRAQRKAFSDRMQAGLKVEEVGVRGRVGEAGVTSFLAAPEQELPPMPPIPEPSRFEPDFSGTAGEEE